MKTKITVILSSLLIVGSLNAKDDLFDKNIEDIMLMDSELKADIGSRDGARNYLDSNTPVDVITYKQIESSGLTSLTDVLRYFVAGFNAPETSVADGSDHVRAFTLRGMSPDQVLILINGKRLHTSSLLHVNGTIGRGSTNVDLDTVALKSIEKIEIMRDGASAQYGSDAISGVINIILKGMGYKNVISAQGGQRSSGDGTLAQADAFITIPLDYDGFINLTMDAKKQEQTQRAGEDSRLAPPSVKTHAGIPDSQNYKAMLNAEIVQKNNINFYANALFNYRDSEASAFYRPSSSDSTPVYADGFLPMINAKILDYSVVIGVQGEFADSTTWNISNVYGSNNTHYMVSESMNYTLGATSPTSFDNGSLNFIQNTTSIDLTKKMDSFKIAGGVEYRYENYSIIAGDEASYSGTGSQGFVGYRPENETDKSRFNFAMYMDTVFYLSKKFTLEMLARYEEYSDFGESTNAKLALSYKLTPKILLRTSGSTGFRAPSLAQSYYSQTSSFVDSTTGNLSSQGTFRTDHEVSVALGATPLRSERSKNFSIGSVYQPTKDISFMIDYFYIEVNDRIMLTGDLSGDTQTQKDILAKYNVSEARYFTNAANTKTQGFDIKLNYKYIFANSSKLDINAWYNCNENTIVGSSSQTEKVRVEDGQPADSLRLLTSYEIKKLNLALNFSKYGSYSQMMDNKTYTFDEAYTVDLDLAYNFTKEFKLAVGGLNIFDTVPNKWDGLSGAYYGSNGIKPYSRYSPFGYSGAYYYLRASLEF